MAYNIWTTGACNLRCKYCYEGLDKPNLHMQLSVAQKVLNYIISDFKTEGEDELLINFHGGEPFLNFPIIKFFVSELKSYYRNKCKMAFSVTTNATVLTDEIFNFVSNENIDITVSIDGNKNTHNQMRFFANGQGSHDIVMENSLKLLDKLTHVRVRMTYNSETVSQLSQNVKYLLDKGFLTIAPGIDSFDNRWDTVHVDLLKREILKIKKYLKDYPNAHVGICEKLIYCGKTCKGGIVSKHIYYDGSIYPCLVACGHEEFVIGNIFGNFNKTKQEELLAHSLHDNTVCQGCDLDVYCSGARCKIVNKIKTNRYDTPALIDCNYTNLIYDLNGVSFPS